MIAPVDECTYCGTGGEELGVARMSILAEEWFPGNAAWSLVRPLVPACRICARDVRAVQRRLFAANDNAVDPLDVDVMTRRLVRALYRWELNEPLPMDAAIQSVQLRGDRPGELWRAIAAQGLERRELRPGITYWYARTADSDCGSIWYVALWSRIFLFAKTLRP